MRKLPTPPDRLGLGGVRLFAVFASLVYGSILCAAAQELDLSPSIPGSAGENLSIQADGDLEWRRDSGVITARGNVRAQRGQTELRADKVSAALRNLGKGAQEIWRIDASGSVSLTSPGTRMEGGKALYHVQDGRVMFSGDGLRLTSQGIVVTARDSLEYDAKRFILTGNGAVWLRQEARQVDVHAPVLIAYLQQRAEGGLMVSRISGRGGICVSVAGKVAHAVYGEMDMRTNIATMKGNVSLSQGGTVARGEALEINFKTGISRLLSGRNPIVGLITSSTAPTHLARCN